jgi:FkbM family methyltransferase
MRGNRYLLFLKRMRAAQEFGFRFPGTSRMQFPPSAYIAGQQRDLVAPDDPAIAYDIINVWLDDEYGLRCAADNVRTIVDIGANVGLFSLLARHRFPAATIHAYEPDKNLLGFTERNLAGCNVVIHGEGVASADGHCSILSRGSSRANRTISTSEGTKLTSLAAVVERVGGAIDLLKIDCEGAEWDIFRDKEAIANVRAIRMEYHLWDGRTLDDLRAFAVKLGFRISIKSEADKGGYGIAWLDNATLDPRS